MRPGSVLMVGSVSESQTRPPPRQTSGVLAPTGSAEAANSMVQAGLGSRSVTGQTVDSRAMASPTAGLASARASRQTLASSISTGAKSGPKKVATRVIQNIARPQEEEMLYVAVPADENMVTLELWTLVDGQRGESLGSATFPFHDAGSRWSRAKATLQTSGGRGRLQSNDWGARPLSGSTLEVDIYFGTSVKQLSVVQPQSRGAVCYKTCPNG